MIASAYAVPIPDNFIKSSFDALLISIFGASFFSSSALLAAFFAGGGAACAPAAWTIACGIIHASKNKTPRMRIWIFFMEVLPLMFLLPKFNCQGLVTIILRLYTRNLAQESEADAS